MKKNLFILVFICILLCGCSSEPEVLFSGVTRTIEVPISTGTLYSFEMPVELETISTDNHNFWEFNDGSEIYCMSGTNLTNMEYSKEYDLYENDTAFCKVFDDCYIIVTNGQDCIKEYLSKGVTREVNAVLYKELESDSLPAYEEQEMEMTKANLYIPLNSKDEQINAYMVSLVSTRDDWLESWLIDGTADDIVGDLCTLAMCNTNCTKIDKWYQSEDIIFITAENNIVAAKKLRYNEWYIYYGTTTYKDYILQGINKVHAE